MENSKKVDYAPLINSAIGEYSFAKEKDMKEVIRPSHMKKLHPYKKGMSLLDIDAKEDLRGNFAGKNLEIKKIFKLSELLYGDLFSKTKESLESREKFGKYILAGLSLFKKASHEYFEKKDGFKEFEKKLRSNFIDSVPNPEDIKSLFFAGNKKSLFPSEEEMVWSRVILQSSLPATYRAEDPDSWEDLDMVQKDLTEIMNSFIKGGKLLGISEAEVIELKGQEKNPIRIDQKHFTKPGLDKLKIPDAVRNRLILKVKDGSDKKEVLGRIAEKINKKLSRSKKKYNIEFVEIEDPGDSSRTEFKVEGIIQNKTFEISIFDNDAHEIDEKYGPYAHEIYEFAKGDATYLSRMGMLEKGWIEKRVNYLDRLDSWKNIPSNSYKKILREYKDVIKRKKGVEKITIKKEIDGKKKIEKFYTISESTARAIIRYRLREKTGFRFDPGNNRYFQINQALNKQSSAIHPEKIYELQRIAKDIKEVVNNQVSKKIRIDENTAMGIITGNTYKVHKNVFEAIERKMGLKFEKK